MTVRVLINGFGRMGRLSFRAAFGKPGFEDLAFVHLNETGGDATTAAHLLTFDSVHGRYNHDAQAINNEVIVDGHHLTFSQFASPGEIPTQDLGIDLVIESSGMFRTRASLQPYFEAGVKKVIVAAPVKDADLNIVMGCNDDEYNPVSHHLVTAASCTTNCLAPVVKVIHEGLGIKHGLITTLHDVTNTQTVVDKPLKDLRRSRSALNSLIPTTTGSATAITMIYPELKGKLNGIAVRVPLLNASLTDAVFEVNRQTTVEEVNALLKAAADGSLNGILGYEERPLVSADYVNDPRSGIVDAQSTMVNDGTQIKVMIWYDNEIGYATRMMELAAKVAENL